MSKKNKKNPKPTEPDETYIMCARADAGEMVQGSSFKYKCSVCNTPIMIAPSGQEYLKKHPGAKLVCPCQWFKMIQIGATIGTPTLDELRSEFKSIVPNTYRNRN